MTRTLRATVTPTFIALAAALSLLCAPAGATAAVSPLPASNYSVHSACAPPAPGHASCLALELRPATAAARAHTHPLGITRSTPIVAGRAAEGAFGLRPQDLHTAYQLPTGAASAQTIAIVDAYNDPNAEADLNVYSREFALPECTTASGCFKKVNQRGETGNLPFPESQVVLEATEATCEFSSTEAERNAACHEVEEAKGWTTEISLDIEVAHATCQNCSIVLVEANSTRYRDLQPAENTAVAQGATEVSNSWGGGEPGPDSSAFNHPGTVITASTGDYGYLDWAAENPSTGPQYPASSPHVVAVGGTRLTLSSPASTWQNETVWNGQGASGGGCSLAFNAQPWQSSVSDWSSVGCGSKRASADVSADADPYTGVAVFDSQPGEFGATWRDFGGTSLASPLIASVFALAGGSAGAPYPARTLYENEVKSPASLHDIVTGSNGRCTKPPVGRGESGCPSSEEAASCSGALICQAAAGYDGPTGVGTPEGIAAFEPFGGNAPNASPSVQAPSTTSTTTTTGGQTGASPASPVAPGTVIPVLSGLSLTRGAIVALHRTRPLVSRLKFAFTCSVPVRVRVTLARWIRVRGHARWQTLRGALTMSAVRGRNSAGLRGHNALATGRYRLTLTPARGTPRSLTFHVG